MNRLPFRRGSALVLGTLLLVAPMAAREDQPVPYSDLEALRVENLALKKQIVVRHMLDWQRDAQALKADLEKGRPGWVFNPEDGSWAKAPEKK